jgi:hypothetical protein
LASHKESRKGVAEEKRVGRIYSETKQVVKTKRELTGEMKEELQDEEVHRVPRNSVAETPGDLYARGISDER